MPGDLRSVPTVGTVGVAQWESIWPYMPRSPRLSPATQNKQHSPLLGHFLGCPSCFSEKSPPLSRHLQVSRVAGSTAAYS